MPTEDEEPQIAKSTHLKRLQAKQDALDALNRKHEALQATVAELQAKQDSTPDYAKLEKRHTRLVQRHAELEHEHATYQANAVTERALLAVGIVDIDDQALVRWRWERIEEAKRPTLAKFLGEDGAAREDRHLRTLFESTAADQADDQADDQARELGAQNGHARRSILPPVQQGISEPSAPPKAMTREAILAMPVEERTKPEMREAIWRALQT